MSRSKCNYYVPGIPGAEHEANFREHGKEHVGKDDVPEHVEAREFAVASPAGLLWKKYMYEKKGKKGSH